VFSLNIRILKKSLLSCGLTAAVFGMLAASSLAKDIDACVEGLCSWELAKKKEAYVRAELPARIELISVNKDEALRDFDVGVAFFRSVWDKGAAEDLRGFAREIRERGISSRRGLEIYARLKEIRAPLKMLRVLYVALSSDHELPEAIDELTTAIGRLGNVILGERGGPEDLVPAAERVEKALKRKPLQDVEDEIRDFEPARRDGFDRWVKKAIKETREIVAARKGTPEDFHTVRKNLQAILSVYKVEMEFHPQRKSWKQVALFLFDETERLGDNQERWEKQDSAGELRFKKTQVRFPTELVLELLAFLDRIES
jgi:hypothetical protein